MSRTFSTDPLMAAALLADAEKLETMGQDPGPSLEDLYEGAECVCGAQACVTDVNGIDLCMECAEACRIPEADA